MMMTSFTLIKWAAATGMDTEQNRNFEKRHLGICLYALQHRLMHYVPFTKVLFRGSIIASAVPLIAQHGGKSYFPRSVSSCGVTTGP
jgi:hypothetical protein